MKEQIVNEFMQKLLDYANNAEAFARSEAPEYIEELLKYAVIENKIWMTAIILVNTLLAGGSAAGVFYGWNGGIIIAIGTILATMTIINIFAITAGTMKIYKIKTAPRVYIVDYIRGQK